MAAAHSESRFVGTVLGRTLDKHQSDREEVIHELGKAKHELVELKLQATSASAAKARAEDEAEAKAFRARAASLSHSIEEMRKQIDASEEELVLVELARIEADRERREIEARRTAEAAEFAEKIRAFNQEIKHLGEEVVRREKLQVELDFTNSAIAVLQVELDSLRADRKLGEEKREASSLCRSLLAAAADELKAAKEEWASVKEEAFQFMNAMDGIREEVVRIAERSSKLKRLEKKAESSAAQLEAKLLKAKTKLEAMTMAESRTRSIVSNLSAAALQLGSEAEAAAREKELIWEETRCIRSEIARIEMEISSAEEKLRALAQALLEAKAAETTAVKRLRSASKSAVRRRASMNPFFSTITICKSEHDYLIKKAAAARTVADKKVAAADAWREAAVDRERKAAREAESVEKRIREMRAAEVRKLHETTKSVFARRSLEEEINKLLRTQNLAEQEEEDDDVDDDRDESSQGRDRRRPTLQRSRSNRLRRINPPSSPAAAARQVRSPLIAIKKRRKVMPNLVKFLKHRTLLN